MVHLVTIDGFSCKIFQDVELSVVAVIHSAVNNVTITVNQTYSKVGQMRPVASWEDPLPLLLMFNDFREEAQNEGSQDPALGDSQSAAAQAQAHCPEEAAHAEKQGGSCRVRKAVGQEDEGTFSILAQMEYSSSPRIKGFGQLDCMPAVALYLLILNTNAQM